MKNVFLLSILSIFIFTSCATISSPAGPYVADGTIFGSTKGPIIATNNSADTRRGEACAINVLGLVSWGDNSIDEARLKGRIKTISTVDFNRFSVLGLFSKVCTVVVGE